MVSDTLARVERLRPLLTDWALLSLRRNRVQQGSDEHIIAYLSRDSPRAPTTEAEQASGADDPLNAHIRDVANKRDAESVKERLATDAQRWQWLVSRLSAEHMQLLNLARTWLHSVLPHILCKAVRPFKCEPLTSTAMP